MKVLIAAASVSSNLSGIQRHAFNVAHCLLTHPAISQVQLVVAPWQRRLVDGAGLLPSQRLGVHVAEMNPSSLSRNRWYYRQLPGLARSLESDVVHLSYPVPVNGGGFSCPLVLTLHDLYPYEIPSNFGLPKVLFNRFILQQCLRSVTSIACVSNATCLQLSRYAPRRIQQKALRIYNCVEPKPQSRLEEPMQGRLDGPFLLCVAQHRRNKNISFLVRVFETLMVRGQINSSMLLAVVGMAGPETRRIQRAIASSGLAGNILLMEGLSEPELQWCYRNSVAVLAPSTTEGFGLPVVEALLAGCRVVCSDIPVFRELGGDRCHYVPLDGRAEDGFAEAVVAALEGPRSGPIVMPQFSAPVIAAQYVDLYRKLLAPAGTARDTPASANAGYAGRCFL